MGDEYELSDDMIKSPKNFRCKETQAGKVKEPLSVTTEPKINSDDVEVYVSDKPYVSKKKKKVNK